MRYNATHELPSVVRERLPDVALQQIYLDSFNARAHERDSAVEDDSQLTIRLSHAAGWLAVAEHLAHVNRDPDAVDKIGPHPLLQPDESKDWARRFGDSTPLSK